MRSIRPRSTRRAATAQRVFRAPEAGTIPTIAIPGAADVRRDLGGYAEKLNQETGRKAMIILTDGDDQGSKTKIQEAVAAAQRSNCIIYVILIADTGFYGGWG